MMRMFSGRGRGRALTAVAISVALVLATNQPVAAQRVANPGSLTLRAQRMNITIGTNVFSYDAASPPQCSDGVNNGDADGKIDYPTDPQCSSASDDSEIKSGEQTKTPPSFVGSVDGSGAVTIPTSGVTFPTAYVENSSAGGDGVVTVTIVPTTAVTGTVDPLTNAAALRVPVQMRLAAANLPSGCAVGTTALPIDLANLRTSNSGGVPYASSTGAMALADHTFSVPASNNCGFAGGSIDSSLGLPSASGRNDALFDLRATPILTKAITPVLAAPPTSVTAPASVTLDATGSTATRTIVRYDFDADGNGTTDVSSSTPTATFNYTRAGTFTPRVSVVDDQGDAGVAIAAGSIAVAPDPTVTTVATRLTADPVRAISRTYGKYRVKFRATLTEAVNGAAVAGASVRFLTVDGKYTCTATTSSTGVVMCGVTYTPVAKTDPRTYTASFAGDSTRGAATSAAAVITYP